MMPDEPATLHALRRRQVLKGALAAAAPLVLPAPAQAAEAKPLIVGGLPVTCNLTLPIACQARTRVNQQRGAGPSPFAYAKFSGWPEVKESLMTGRIQAAYMLAPLVMDLVDSRIPLKIVSLGHRSGARQRWRSVVSQK